MKRIDEIEARVKAGNLLSWISADFSFLLSEAKRLTEWIRDEDRIGAMCCKFCERLFPEDDLDDTVAPDEPICEDCKREQDG